MVPLREPDPELQNIFMIHGAGGDLETFEPVGQHLRDRYNVWGIRATSGDTAASPHCSWDEMATSYLAEIRSAQPSGPYLLAGFSTGGIVAIELMRRLRDSGEVVEALAVIDTFHPSMQPRTIPKSEHLVKLLRLGPRYGVSRAKGRLQGRRASRKGRVTSAGQDPESLRRKLFEHIIHLWDDYPVGQVECPMIVMSSEEIFDIWEGVIDDARGWTGAVDDLTVVKVPGDHMTLLDEPHAGVFADRFAAALKAG